METKLRHSGYAGGKRDEGADHRQETSEENGETAIFLEKIFRAIEIVTAEEHEAAEALDGGAATPGAEPIGRDGTEIAADGAGGGHPKELELSGVDEIAGEGHDDLGGERDTGRFDAHEQGDACIATGGDNGNDEGGQGGYDFF